METLEPIFGVSRETVCVSVGCEIESSPGQLPADDVAVRHVKLAYFAPKQLFDLSLGWCGCDDDGVVVRHQPPYDCECGGECFTCAVAGSDGYFSVICDGVEDVALFFQGRMFKTRSAKLTGFLAYDVCRWSTSSAGGVALRAATDRLRFLVFGSSSGLAASKYGFLRAADLG